MRRRRAVPCGRSCRPFYRRVSGAGAAAGSRWCLVNFRSTGSAWCASRSKVFQRGRSPERMTRYPELISPERTGCSLAVWCGSLKATHGVVFHRVQARRRESGRGTKTAVSRPAAPIQMCDADPESSRRVRIRARRKAAAASLEATFPLAARNDRDAWMNGTCMTRLTNCISICTPRMATIRSDPPTGRRYPHPAPAFPQKRSVRMLRGRPGEEAARVSRPNRQPFI